MSIVPTVVLFGKSLNPYYLDGKKRGMQQGTKAECDVFVASIFEVGDPTTISLEGTGVNNDVHAILGVSGNWQLSGQDGFVQIDANTYYVSSDQFNGSKYNMLQYTGS